MKRVVAIIVAAILLSGCAATALPPWLVKLTPSTPYGSGSCTGVMIDERSVLTADHCSRLTRGILPDGTEMHFLKSDRILGQDLALLSTKERVTLYLYAPTAEARENVPARVYGVCPRYFSFTYRPVQYVGRLVSVDTELRVRLFDTWNTVDSADHDFVCGGDSGGPVVQNGRVVGVISTVISPSHTHVAGHEFNTVPVAEIIGRYEASKSEIPATVEVPHSGNSKP